MATRDTARAPARPHLAVFDATTLLAKAVRDQLVARKLPTRSVRLFTSSDDPEANLTEFGGEAMMVSKPDLETLGALDIAFFCGSSREGALYLDWPRQAGFVAIDLTSASQALKDVPVVNVGVNPDAIGNRPVWIATPQPASQILSNLLAPVERRLGLRSCAAVILQPVSELGDEGVSELYQQTVGLLNFKEMPTAVFGRQMAFNVLPSELAPRGGPSGGPAPARVESEVRAILGRPVEVSVEIVQVPVFHCHAVAAHLVLPEPAGRDRLLECFRGGVDFVIASPGGPATPVERAGETSMLVAGVRETGPGSFWLWAVADNLVAGVVQNAVRIAETLIERGIGGTRL